jgi:cyclic pyranopterin phosphate synthase
MRWAHGRGMDLTLIETMPMGEIEVTAPTSICRSRCCAPARWNSSRWTDIAYKTGGPARYVEVKETGGRLGFITPMTHNFCESCNRVRLTCTGTLYMCLGQDDAADLRAPLRASEATTCCQRRHRRGHRPQAKGHDFVIDRREC